MGKKIAKSIPAVEKPVAAEELSEAIQRKKENAKLLEKQLKKTTAKVLATLDVKQAAKAVKALQELKKR